MLFLGGVILYLFVPALGLGLILAGAILFASTLYHARKPETKTVVDERVERINEKVGYHAFWITLLSIFIIYWMNYLKLFNVALKDVSNVLILIGIYSWLFLRFYFSKRGLE